MYNATICGYKVKLYRHNFTLLLIPIILTLTLVLHDHHKYIYAPINLGICALIMFLNFPSIVISLHSRPIYYDDLVIKDYNEDEAAKFYDDTFRRKYQKVFCTAIAITSSILVMITVELWYYRSRLFNDNNEYSTQRDQMVKFVVVLSILGGLLRVYYAATMGIGKLIMIVLRQIKKREQRLLREKEQEHVMYRLTQSGLTLNSRPRHISLNIDGTDNLDSADADNQLLLARPRSSSCSNIENISVIGFKPTLMSDIFNDIE